MQIKFLPLVVVCFSLANPKDNIWSTAIPAISQPINQDTSGEWEILFNGTDTQKWERKGGGNLPLDGWVVRDGTLFLAKKGAGDIVTKEEFGSFVLILHFMLTDNANSGIKYFVGKLTNKKTGKIAINGPEFQIIDDYNHPAVKNHSDDIASTASCYLLYVPENKQLHPAGEWNHMKIVAQGRNVEHWLNGVKVLSYRRGSKDFEDRKLKTKFKDWEGYGTLPKGRILLTDHNDTVYFKNIKIRRL